MLISGFHKFKNDIGTINIPQQLDDPFYYEPSKIAVIAAQQLQDYIAANVSTDFTTHVGKMFGVLVVKTQDNTLGFLAAFSGRLDDSMTHDGFVPPMYDMLQPDGFFLNGSARLEKINNELETVRSSLRFRESVIIHHNTTQEMTAALDMQRATNNKRRLRRRAVRRATTIPTDLELLKKQDHQHTLNDQFLLKEYEVYLKEKHATETKNYTGFQCKIKQLEADRINLSNQLQEKLFKQYNFLNATGETKNVLPIFTDFINDVPPSGSGDCAAPKLFQQAYKKNMQPVALAEFWYGKPSPSQVRKDGQFYPVCRSKCEPILNYMLQGLNVAPSTLNTTTQHQIKILYQDKSLVIINKPADLLSVPGKQVKDSVAHRMRQLFPKATGAMIVHRLDMSTSGIMLIALTEQSYYHLQQQFIKRTIKKEYTAILAGTIKEKTGIIDLPLRVDLDNRPRQLVCYDHGKAARTIYKVIDEKENRTRVLFEPVTGRTHQLRVHAAHHSGLGVAILGDDLYGQKANRLHLHASKINFIHPDTNIEMSINCKAPF